MIGIFDSGIGGLTVLKALKELMPQYSYLYLGDTARMPYGNKSQETIIRYSIENTQWLLANGATIIVVACNTASAVATESLKKNFPDVPIFEVITPAAKKASEQTISGNVGVLATRGTIMSGVYERKLHLLNPKLKIISVAAPLLVPLIEEGWIDDPETTHIAHRYLLGLENIDTLILGCTHYPLLAPVIQKLIGKKVTLVSSGTSVAKEIKTFLEANTKVVQAIQTGKSRYSATDLTPQLNSLASAWLGEAVKFEKVTVELSSPT